MADRFGDSSVEQKVKVEIPFIFVSGDCLFYYFIGHCSLYLCGNKIMKSLSIGIFIFNRRSFHLL